MIVVWGGIAYQIMNGMSPEENIQNVQTITIAEPVKEKEITRYKLSLKYEDPFHVSKPLSHSMRVADAPINTSLVNRKPSPPVQEKTIQWPFVKYGGKVKSSNNKQVGLLTIAGRSFLVKKGQVVKEVTVIDYSEESIVVEYMNEQKVISK